MSENPYQSPAPASSLPLQATRSGAIVSTNAPVVDGDALVVTSGTILPDICVKTNQPVSVKDRTRKILQWSPPWIAVFLLLGLIPLLIAYALTNKKCTLTYSVDPSVRKKYRKRILIKVLIALGLFIAMPLSVEFHDGAVMIFLILFIVAFIAIFIGNAPLRIKNHKNGSFWIKGFSEDYLASFAEGG